VQWTASALTVTDEVTLADGKHDTILFRWHLGTTQGVTITGSGRAFTVRWADATIELQGSVPLVVLQRPLPDNTLGSGTGDGGPDPVHTCIVVQSKARVAAFRLTTAVVPQSAPLPSDNT